jgi:hypothetical protein
MDPSAPLVALGPLLQYGFAGFCLIQFGTFVWLGLRGIDVLTSLRDALAAQTAATAAVNASIEELRKDAETQPCRMTLEQLREFIRRLQPQGGL